MFSLLLCRSAVGIDNTRIFTREGRCNPTKILLDLEQEGKNHRSRIRKQHGTHTWAQIFLSSSSAIGT